MTTAITAPTSASRRRRFGSKMARSLSDRASPAIQLAKNITAGTTIIERTVVSSIMVR